MITILDEMPQQPEVHAEPKEQGGPSVAPDTLVQEGGRVSLTIPELLGVI